MCIRDRLYLVPILGGAAAMALIVAPQALARPFERVGEAFGRLAQRLAPSRPGAAG